MPAEDHRLTTREMARFVAEGYLRFDALVPEDLNARAEGELRRILPAKITRFLSQVSPAVATTDVPDDPERPAQPSSSTPLSSCYPPPSALGELLRLPAVAGIIESLVGPDPLFDHDFVHYIPARGGFEQLLHMDAIVDWPDPSFDVQLFYFPHDVAEGEGGTRFVPGSHLRHVRAEGISRYQHIVGEQHFAGPAGTILVFHHGLWHAGQPNPSEHERWMYKIRLNPRVPQQRLWNTDDLDALHNDASDHIFATMPEESVGGILRRSQRWQRGHEERYELTQRTRLWRYLSGDDRYDVDYYLTRLERRSELLP
jgi:hypothetical protein